MSLKLNSGSGSWAVAGDGLDELLYRLLRAFRLRPRDGQGADGANRPEHLSPPCPVIPAVDGRHPRETASDPMC
jgi:hypothetical protein